MLKIDLVRVEMACRDARLACCWRVWSADYAYVACQRVSDTTRHDATRKPPESVGAS